MNRSYREADGRRPSDRAAVRGQAGTAPSVVRPAANRSSLAEELGLVAHSVAQVLAGHHLPVEPGGPALPQASRAAVRDMAYAAVRDLGRLRALLNLLNRRSPDAPVLALQVAALGQLLDGRRPAAVVVDQAVAAARANADTRAAAGLVNAVLRRFVRERPALLAAVADDPQARWNFPPWWIDRVRQEYPDDWQAMLALANRPPPLTLRVNARRTTVEDYRALLAQAGIDSAPLGGQALRLAQAVPVGRLPGFEAGLASVQDAGAQLAAQLLPVRDGQRVLDACAAPGGKSAALLERADLRLVCLDRDEQRLDRLRTDMERLHLEPDKVMAADAAEPSAWWDGEPFDAILADVPCSASGIVRRHAEIRWLRRRRDIATFAASQSQILAALWPTLKPGGTLLYATCSVFGAEGADIVDAFLRDHPAARRLPLTAVIGGSRQPVDQLLPCSSDMREHDGFYYALIEKLR
ncbi:MAG: 16S rRNA (cytosine(967)-C(5))-methyltransferase RsmB [Burkholderiaceae bacterium]